MFCALCGADNPNDGNFCLKCGAVLQGQKGMPGPALGGSAQSYTGPTETSGMAVGSLICGVLFFFLPTAIVAIVLGHISLSQIRKSAGRIKGHGMAVAGLVLGYMGVAFIPILIVAAIAIPNLIRARIAANQSSAAASLRTISAAAIMYSATYSNGYPPSLEVLDGAGTGDASCDHAQLIDSVLAGGQKSGYLFTYTLQTTDGNAPVLSPEAAKKGCTVPGGSAFTVTAEPVSQATGTVSYFVDQTFVIRESTSEPATADSPPIE